MCIKIKSSITYNMFVQKKLHSTSTLVIDAYLDRYTDLSHTRIYNITFPSDEKNFLIFIVRRNPILNCTIMTLNNGFMVQP